SRSRRTGISRCCRAPARRSASVVLPAPSIPSIVISRPRPAMRADGTGGARAMSGAHPDLTWVSPSGAHEILVSDIDQPVVAAASKTPFESARRVFVIEHVDELGDESANRMLKTLE